MTDTIADLLTLTIPQQKHLRDQCREIIGDDILPEFDDDHTTQKQRRTWLLGTDQDRQHIQSERNNLSIQRIKQHQHHIHQLINQINETPNFISKGNRRLGEKNICRGFSS